MMTMTKKYAICEVHAVTGDHITILNMEEYCTAMCDIDIIEESDDYYHIRKVYDEKYDRRYVTGIWLRNNGYLDEDVYTFGGPMKRYTNNVKGTTIEIVLPIKTEDVGYQVKFSNPMKSMEINDRSTLLTIKNFNVMFNLFI